MNNTNNNQLVVKSNQLIESSYKLSTQEQRIILLMASMIKPEDKDFYRYQIKIKDFINIIGIKDQSKYPEVKKITKGLLEKVLIIKTADSELQIGWLCSAEYFNRKGFVELEFSPKLKPFLLKLKEFFTKYQLENIIKLRSSYSIRIYELLKQYEKIGERAFSLEELKRILGIKPDKYKLYGDFKRKILKLTQKELRQRTDISFDLKERKDCRKVIGLIFLIRSNKTHKQKQEASEELLISKIANKELYQKLKDYFCLSSAQIQKVLKEHDEDSKRILDNLAYVENKYQRGEIKNIGAYTLKAIQENYSNQSSMFDIEKQENEEQERKKEAQKCRIDQLKENYDIYYKQEAEKARESLLEAKLEALKQEVWMVVKEKYGENGVGLNTFHRIILTDRLAKMAGALNFKEWKKQELSLNLQ